MYHPLYNVAGPLGIGTVDDPFDLTSEGTIFQSHQRLEWFRPHDSENYAPVVESKVDPR